MEIELKAHIFERESIEARLAQFMRLVGSVDKRDEYWDIPSISSHAMQMFRIRLRHENSDTTITFKEKTFEGDIEINQEFEFGIDNESTFRTFITRLQGRFVYAKQKKGTRWEDGHGIVAEVVEVAPLGLFLEVECVGDSHDTRMQEWIKMQLYQVIDRCGIPRSALEPRPYSQMLGQG